MRLACINAAVGELRKKREGYQLEGVRRKEVAFADDGPLLFTALSRDDLKRAAKINRNPRTGDIKGDVAQHE